MASKTLGQPSVKDMLAALKRRCPWAEIRLALQKAELPIGHGWDALEEKASGSSDEAKAIRDNMHAFYIKYLLAGERYTQLYDVTADKMKVVIAKLQNGTIPESDYSTNYPFPLQSSKLSLLSAKPVLVAIESLINGDLVLVFCSSRSFSERMKYQDNEISPQVKQVYSGIDELITIKKIYFQAFDLVICRSSLKRIEVCIDQPNLDHLDFEKHALKILGAAAAHIADLQEIFQSKPLNVFSTIKEIFEEPKEGKVRSLSFRTLTGSRKSEKMVRSADDLRTETFHYAGMTAVKHEISPYELTVEWVFPAPLGRAEIEFKAAIKALSFVDPHLTGFYVKAIESVSFLEAVNKVVKYLP